MEKMRSKYGLITKELLKLINNKNLERLKNGKNPLSATKIQRQISKIIDEDPLLYEKFIKL